VSTYGGRSFCPTCGGRVTSVGEEEAEVMLGSLDVAPTELEPKYELWTVRREHWLQPLPGAHQFGHDRTEGEAADEGEARIAAEGDGESTRSAA
ncbi:MAG: GFA family protein, partial [Mesorhizobium sp.]